MEYIAKLLKINMQPNTPIEDLLKFSNDKYGNVYPIIIPIVSSFTNATIYGGILRDIFANKEDLIKDLDLKWERSGSTHQYDGSKFIDLVPQDLVDKFKDLGLEVIIEKTSVVSLGSKAGYFDVKSEPEKENEEEDSNLVLTDDELLKQIMYPKVTPGHNEYSLTIIDKNGNKYPILIDITFPKGNETCCSPVEEDSLAFKKDISGLLSLQEDPFSIIEKIKKELEENTTSFLEKDPKLLISNLKNNIVTVNDLNSIKRIAKIGKLDNDGFTINGLTEEHVKKIRIFKNLIESGKEKIPDGYEKNVKLILNKVNEW